MKKLLFAIVAIFFSTSVFAQGRAVIPNPIMFVTQVPMPFDSSTCTAAFCNHKPDVFSAVRGGDLYIIYPDGTQKNLTQTAGFGNSGQQGTNSIAVRQPCVHWNGTKAVFSMVVGAPATQGAAQPFFWQLYEVTNIGENQTPVITKVSNQPANYNNVSPIYGTDGRIIFTSDRPRGGLAHLYPLLDEYRGAVSTSGLWSLDPTSGDLFQLSHIPSGAFTPLLDSYGRLIYTRWDHLQRDGNADKDALGQTNNGTFNYSDESATATNTNSRIEIFPEPQASRTDLLSGTNINGMEFNQFFPWQINEDGTSEETLNHVGRQELRFGIGPSINNDQNVTATNYATSGRLNSTTFLNNFFNVSEDPTNQGNYYGIDCPDFGTHGAGQILKLTGMTTLDPGQMALTNITDKTTSNSTQESGSPAPTNSGKYRNPQMLSSGKLIASYSASTFNDKNIGSGSQPQSRYDFRLKTLKLSGNVWVSDSLITNSISKSVTYWDPNQSVSYNGVLWEIDPVEVRARTIPTRRVSILASPEQQVFAEEGVDETTFRNDMKQKGIALIVSRNVVHRDKTDHQQPYFLKVHNSTTQSANASGKIYDAAHFQLYQADMIRGMHWGGSVVTTPGRRVLPQFMHDSAVTFNPPTSGETPFTVKIASDGSIASFVPARRAISWAIVDSSFNTSVRERYWITTQPGEIRVCASCHGTNDEALSNPDPAPQNKPLALRVLLQYWKSSHSIGTPQLVSPASDSIGVLLGHQLVWQSVTGATTYHLQVSKFSNLSIPIIDDSTITATSFASPGFEYNTRYYWRVQAKGDQGASTWSPTWTFKTTPQPFVPGSVQLLSPTNDSTGVLSSHPFIWKQTTGATSYELQCSKNANLSLLIIDDSTIIATSYSKLTFDSSTSYYWRARAKADGGYGGWSPIWKFTTNTVQVPTAPKAPSLISPTNDSTGVLRDHPLIWQASVGATNYRAQLSKQANFSSLLVDDSMLTTSVYQTVLPLEYATTYYWRAYAWNETGTSPWSNVWHFTTTLDAKVEQNDQTQALRLDCTPNPVSLSALVFFTLPTGQHIRIRVFDMLGVERSIIAEGYFDAGTHEINWQTPLVTNGVYYCRLETGSSSITKVIVIRK